MREFLLQLVEGKLSHATCSAYANAVRTCLLHQEWEFLDDWKTQKVMREKVLARLNQSVI